MQASKGDDGPASSAWRQIRQLLEFEGVRFEVTPLVPPALAVYISANPGIGLVIGEDGGVEVQVHRAVVEWFPPSGISRVVARALPELLAASRDGRILNEVMLDRRGFVRRARTTFRGQTPTGLRNVHEATFGRQVRRQEPPHRYTK